MSIKRIYTLIVTILTLAGIGFITYFVWNTFFQKDGFRVNTDGTAVVKEIQKLQRLETASYTIEQIIDAGTQGNRFQEFLYGDRILLIANGQVVAGFDFAKIQPQDIQVQGQTIVIRAPAPEILYTRLDNSKTRVYDRNQGILTKGEKDLESAARSEAELSIRNAACEAGVLDTAEENGRKQLTALLTALRFQDITINIPKGSCN